jgi:glycosyltransferase involved in cell wall biosynthesis
VVNSGRCHYSFNCEKYKVKSTACPFFEGHKFSDLSERGFKIKRKIYSKYSNFNFVSPSKWLQKCAENAALTGTRTVYLIPNALDNRIFKRIEKRAARDLFGINENDLVVAFGAVNIDSPYKGWEYLQKALLLLKSSIPDKKLTILVFGKCNKKALAELIPFNTIFTGFLKDDLSTSLVYNASDVFVTPSLADNLPTTVLESLSCGTAVVGFNTGGIPDMINHKKNGYIAHYKNTEDLAEGIKYCISNRIKGETLPEFGKDEILNKHKELLRKITNKDLF